MSSLARPQLPVAPDGTLLWLVRHAEVAERWQGKAYGDLDVELSPRGEEQTEALAAELAQLGPTSVTSSPLQRAHRLAARTAELAGTPHHVDDGLREITRGRWQTQDVVNLDPDEVRSFYADPWSWNGHGGENDAQLAARVTPSLERALVREPLDSGGHVILVAHLNVIRVLLTLALDIPSARSFAWRIDPGHSVVLKASAGTWQLGGSNLHSPTAVPKSIRGSAR